MFKTITVFSITNPITRAALSPQSLQAAIPEPTVSDPDATAWARSGFHKPDNFGGETVFIGANDARLFCIQTRERVLPGKVIRTKVAEKVVEIEERQGRRCGRKEVAGVKDEVIASLLPTAFVKPTETLCMIVKDYLIIGSGSARVVDTCLSILRSAFEEALHFDFFNQGRQSVGWMCELLLSNTTASGLFNIGLSLALKGDNKQTTRFKDVDLESQAVVESIKAGMVPVEIAVNYQDRIHFALTAAMILKRIKFSDVIMEQAYEDAEDGSAASTFDATVALVSGELLELLNRLSDEIPQPQPHNDEDEL
jgi:recombination associated protein RdgC